ncbi:hypothetical protein R9K59_00910, partial [Escherichia coli]|nr:hypothetical protein [Escherichia coli]
MSRKTEFKGTAASRRRARRANLQSQEAISSDKLHRPTPSRVVLQCKLKLKWSTKTGHRVRVFSSIDFPIRLVV